MPAIVLLSQDAVAELLGVTVRTVERWREEGSGPPFVKIGRGVRYDERDLIAWLAERRHRSTSESNPCAA